MLSAADYHLFQLINHLAGRITFLNPVMRFLAEDAQYLFIFGVIIYWFTRVEENRKMIIEAVLSACLAVSVSGILGSIFYRDRPFVSHTVFQLIKHPVNASFPSDHATAAFVIASAVWIFRKRDGYIWLILAACIAFSRVWVGVHYPSDVFAGACIGILSAIFIHFMLMRWAIAQKYIQLLITIFNTLEQKFFFKNQSL